MTTRHVRDFSDPDEVIEADHVLSEVVSLFGMTVSHDTHMPGWRWSVDMRPVVHTELCEVRHVGYALRGVLHVVLEDDFEYEIRGGDVYHIPPHHDGWVVGDQPFEVVEWVGARSWISPVGVVAGRVLATLVMTDIVDSTGTAQSMGDHAWKELLAVYVSRVQATLAAFRGVEVKQTGDGVLSMFDGTARAVRCAVEMRDVATQLGLRTRVAVHTGEVEMTGDDIRGLAVHELTRILQLAEPDQILGSATTQVLTSEPGLVFVDAGEHELKGITGSRRVYAIRDERPR